MRTTTAQHLRTVTFDMLVEASTAHYDECNAVHGGCTPSALCDIGTVVFNAALAVKPNADLMLVTAA